MPNIFSAKLHFVKMATLHNVIIHSFNIFPYSYNPYGYKNVLYDCKSPKSHPKWACSCSFFTIFASSKWQNHIV